MENRSHDRYTLVSDSEKCQTESDNNVNQENNVSDLTSISKKYDTDKDLQTEEYTCVKNTPLDTTELNEIQVIPSDSYDEAKKGIKERSQTEDDTTNTSMKTTYSSQKSLELENNVNVKEEVKRINNRNNPSQTAEEHHGVTARSVPDPNPRNQNLMYYLRKLNKRTVIIVLFTMALTSAVTIPVTTYVTSRPVDEPTSTTGKAPLNENCDCNTYCGNIMLTVWNWTVEVAVSAKIQYDLYRKDYSNNADKGIFLTNHGENFIVECKKKDISNGMAVQEMKEMDEKRIQYKIPIECIDKKMELVWISKQN